MNFDAAINEAQDKEYGKMVEEVRKDEQRIKDQEEKRRLAQDKESNDLQHNNPATLMRDVAHHILDEKVTEFNRKEAEDDDDAVMEGQGENTTTDEINERKMNNVCQAIQQRQSPLEWRQGGMAQSLHKRQSQRQTNNRQTRHSKLHTSAAAEPATAATPKAVAVEQLRAPNRERTAAHSEGSKQKVTEEAASKGNLEERTAGTKAAAAAKGQKVHGTDERCISTRLVVDQKLPPSGREGGSS